VGATLAVRRGRRSVAGLWLGACAFLLVLLWGPHAAATPMEEETAELIRRVDLNPNQALRDGERGLREAQASGDPQAELRAWRLLALVHDELLDMPALRNDIAHGQPLARKLGHTEAQCQFIAAQGAVERNAAHYAEAAALYDQAIALAEHHHLERMRANLIVDKATGPLEEGRQADALALLIQARSMFEALHDRYGIARTIDSMAIAANLSKARPEDAALEVQYHLQALELLDPKVHRAMVLTIYYNLGVSYYGLHDLANARKYLLMGLDLAHEIEGPLSAAYYEFNLAKIERDEKHYARALNHVDAAIPLFKRRGDQPLMVFAALTTRADLLSLLGRYAESVTTLEQARALLPGLNSPTRDARFHEAAAAIHARAGNYEKAYQALKDHGASERRRVEMVNSELAAELKTRFEVQQKDSENALLRAQQREASDRRVILFLGLVLSLVVLAALATYLVFQMRRSRRFAALAMRDELTGLPNRRSITEFARLQWRARSAHEGRLRVAILDIDHFKAVNDNFGHDVGDAVLNAFAQTCNAHLRGSDRLGRYGGEEFLLIMPGSDPAQVTIVFERLQQAVQQLSVPGLPLDRRLTFSMGAAEALGDNDSIADLIHRADEALYRAKQGGRNRCEVAPRVRLAAVSSAPSTPESQQGGQRS
jgi:diguanylate cyclase (GGDEF)-like protein